VVSLRIGRAHPTTAHRNLSHLLTFRLRNNVERWDGCQQTHWRQRQKGRCEKALANQDQDRRATGWTKRNMKSGEFMAVKSRQRRRRRLKSSRACGPRRRPKKRTGDGQGSRLARCVRCPPGGIAPVGSAAALEGIADANTLDVHQKSWTLSLSG
jgi:hypothetical protein